jgi:NADPH-dependent F420 reductase
VKSPDVSDKPVIAVMGGTGSLGSGLARLWAQAGYQVVIGSRSKEKAEAVARELGGGAGTVRGDDNRGAARAGDIVVLSVPYPSHDAIVDEIKADVSGKIVVDATVPLVPPKVAVVQLPEAGSPAVVAQRVLGPEARVVSAFHNVGAKKFQGGEKADCDVLVFGDDPAAREQVIELAGVVATRGIDGGTLANSVAAEALTSVLIAINRRYKVAGAGIRITGLPSPREGQ